MKNKLFIIFGIFAIALAIAGIVYSQSQSGLENELNLNTLNKAHICLKRGLKC